MAARHLHHFRYKPTIFLPKPGSKDIYQRLLKQCENLNIPIINDADRFQSELKSSDAILDAVFGETYLDNRLFKPTVSESDVGLRVLVSTAAPETVRYSPESNDTIQPTHTFSRHPIRMARRRWSSGTYHLPP